MADQRISQLPELSQAAVASGDLLPIADVSASQTKKVKVASLINAGITLIPSGAIDLGLLNQGSTTKIGTSGVADDAITAAKLANDSSVAVQTTAPAVDNFEGRGFFNSSTGNLQVFNGTSYQQVVLDASGISDGAVTAAKIASGTITTAQITSSGLDTAAYADGSVSAAKIASGTITTAQIASGTILGSNISTGTIDTSRIAAGAVAYDRIQAVSATNKLLGRSSAGSGTVEEIDCTAAGRALLDDADAAAQRGTLGLGNLALASGSWQDGSSFAGTSTGTNTGDQTITLTGDVTGTGSGTFAVTIATGTIDTSRIATGAVVYDRIQAVSATDKLLGRSSAGSGTVEEIDCTAAGRALLDDADAAAQRDTLGLGNLALASGSWQDGSSFAGTSTGTNTGDQTITLTGDVTGTGSGVFAVAIASGVVSSGKIADGAVITAKIADGAITADKLDDDSTVVVATAAPAGSGAFIGQQHINTNTGFEYTWTGTEWQRLHGIAAITFSGAAPLTFSGSYPDNFSAEIAVTVEPQSAATFWGGPVSGADAAASFRAIASTDLPLATSGLPGAIEPGTGLEVVSGVLNHSNAISGQTINNVTIDDQGHIQAIRALQPEDIPGLDATKIVTGAFQTGSIADNAITGDKLANYSTALIGETTPVAQFTGQLFFNPLDGAFYMWDSNVWRPIGITVGEIIFAGTYDASTNEVVSITSAGTGAGLTVGSGLPAASEANSSYYVVVSASGTGTAPAPSGVLVPPDLILSDGTSWQEIDTSSTFGSLDASSVVFTPSGSISSTNVQAAIEELDSSTFSTASGPLAGFRNAIINGNFDVWQRGTSFTGSEYSADRWFSTRIGSTHTVTRESFTIGQTDVPNEPSYFLRTAVTSVAGVANFALLRQYIEGVRSFAGQQITLSFWAKADATKSIAIEFIQDFGTGGSPSTIVNTIGVVKKSLTTSWQKITHTVTLPSISGKTLGSDGNDSLRLLIWFDAGSSFDARTDSLGQQSGTFDIAQVQVEAGPVATPFERRPIGTELALCQRYYEVAKLANIGAALRLAPAADTTFGAISSHAVYPYKVSKRGTPSIGNIIWNNVSSQTTDAGTESVRFFATATGPAYIDPGFTIDAEF